MKKPPPTAKTLSSFGSTSGMRANGGGTFVVREIPPGPEYDEWRKPTAQKPPPAKPQE